MGVEAVDRVRELQGRYGSSEGPATVVRLRYALLPSKLPAALAALAEAGAGLLAYPGLGLVWASFDLPGLSAGEELSEGEGLSESEESSAGAGPPEALEDGGWADALFRSAARIAHEAGGSFVCEAAPLWVKRDHDVFGDLGPNLRLARAIKERWDPGRVLNPGRFAGGL
jgi:FAD/FMN-containing dehydrogenase